MLHNQELDPSLEPILAKNIIDNGGGTLSLKVRNCTSDWINTEIEMLCWFFLDLVQLCLNAWQGKCPYLMCWGFWDGALDAQGSERIFTILHLKWGEVYQLIKRRLATTSWTTIRSSCFTSPPSSPTLTTPQRCRPRLPLFLGFIGLESARGHALHCFFAEHYSDPNQIYIFVSAMLKMVMGLSTAV